MTTGERRHRAEKIMAHHEDTPTAPQRAVDTSGLPPWTEIGRLILAEQQKTNEKLGSLERKVDRVNIEIAILKTKAAFVGALAGVLSAWAVSFFKGGK
jgi:hypothetical protein